MNRERRDEPRLLIVETSGKVGLVAVAEGARLGEVRRLVEARRHARDLAPAVAQLRGHESMIPAANPKTSPELRDPLPSSLLELGLERWQRGDADDLWSLEPLYLRPSNAEENWDKNRTFGDASKKRD